VQSTLFCHICAGVHPLCLDVDCSLVSDWLFCMHYCFDWTIIVCCGSMNVQKQQRSWFERACYLIRKGKNVICPLIYFLCIHISLFDV
jgi:hypothetical protein